MTPKIKALLKMLQMQGIRFIIGGGYCLRRIRPFHDVDISVHPDDWVRMLDLLPEGRELEFKYVENPKRRVVHYIYRIPNEKSIDFWLGSVVMGYEYGGPLVKTIVVDGFWEWTEDTALKFKEGTAALGVEKDVRFLKSIGRM